MPQEYLDCVAAAMANGHKKADAQKACAIGYYKKHGKTPEQAAGEEKASRKLSAADRRVIKLSDETAAEVLGEIVQLARYELRGSGVNTEPLNLAGKSLDEIEKEARAGKAISPVQLAREGAWTHPKYGKFSLDKSNFAGFIRNFDARLLKVDLAYDYEHEDDKGAAGWFVPGSMRIEMGADGLAELWADVSWTPRGLKLAIDREYRYSSITFQKVWTDPETGIDHENVILGAAFCVAPWVSDMEPVQSGLKIALTRATEDEMGKSTSSIKLAGKMLADTLVQAMTVSKANDDLWRVFSTAQDMIRQCVLDTDDGYTEADVEAKIIAILNEIPEVARKTIGLSSSNADMPKGLRRLMLAAEKSAKPLDDKKNMEPASVEREKETAGDVPGDDKTKGITKMSADSAKPQDGLQGKAPTEGRGEAITGVKLLDEDAAGGAGVDELSAAHAKLGEYLKEKLAGVDGAPQARHHIDVTRDLINGVVSRTKKAENSAGNDRPGEPDGDEKTKEAKKMSLEIEKHPEVLKLKAQLAEVKAQEEERQAETAALKLRALKADVHEQARKWFPEAGKPTFRLKAGERAKVEALMVELSQTDAANDRQTIKLSGGAALAEEQKSSLLAQFSGIMDALPEVRLNLSSTAVHDKEDSEDAPLDLSDSDGLHKATLKLCAEKGWDPKKDYSKAAVLVARSPAAQRAMSLGR